MDFVRIQNRKTWIEQIPKLYPHTTKWINFWKDQKRKCIEGKWEQDFDEWRYMPGHLHFYVHFCTIVDWDPILKLNKNIRPLLRDIEWEFAYLQLCCKGFSGFENDDEISCHRDLLLYERDKISSDRLHHTCFKSDGAVKKYEDPLQYVRRRHKNNLGLPLYENEAMNAMVLGSRGGGKSYYWTLATLKHNMLFDGKKYYTKDKSISDSFIASFHSSKSGKTIRLIPKSLDEMMSSPDMGAYGNPEDSNFVPHPFYKKLTGSLSEGNGGRPYAHRVKTRTSNAGWKETQGSKIVHGIITADNPETSAGERNDTTLVEEVGLIPNVISFHLSNEATQKRGIKFGWTAYIGTAGNMKKIRETRMMFLNPKEYDIISYIDDYENTGEIGFFLPSYYTDNRFKDHNGNTKVEEAKEYFERRRASKSSNPENLRGEIMNYPMVPSEMWISDSFNVLPANEASEMEDRLSRIKTGTPVDLYWTDGEEVDYRVNPTAQIVPYPYRQHKDKPEGTVCIYDFPYKDPSTGKVPNDAYIIGFDPYATDSEKDARNSFGAAYVMLHPKYYDKVSSQNIIAASYVGRPAMGRQVLLENLEKLIALYGNPIRGLYYENDRGDHVKLYFQNKNKLHLLAMDRVTQSVKGKASKYGWNMGNQHKKLDRINELSDFLKTVDNIDGKKLMRIHRITDIFLHREIQMYDVESKANYDRLVALIGCVVGVNNTYNETKNKLQKENSKLTFLTNNKRIKIKNEKGLHRSATNRKAEKSKRIPSRKRYY